MLASVTLAGFVPSSRLSGSVEHAFIPPVLSCVFRDGRLVQSSAAVRARVCLAGSCFSSPASAAGVFNAHRLTSPFHLLCCANSLYNLLRAVSGKEWRSVPLLQ